MKISLFQQYVYNQFQYYTSIVIAGYYNVNTGKDELLILCHYYI